MFNGSTPFVIAAARTLVAVDVVKILALLNDVAAVGLYLGRGVAAADTVPLVGIARNKRGRKNND